MEDGLGFSVRVESLNEAGMRFSDGIFIFISLVAVGVENKTVDILLEDVASEMLPEDIASKRYIKDMGSEAIEGEKYGGS
jgi:hypothetical protein